MHIRRFAVTSTQELILLHEPTVDGILHGPLPDTAPDVSWYYYAPTQTWKHVFRLAHDGANAEAPDWLMEASRRLETIVNQSSQGTDKVSSEFPKLHPSSAVVGTSSLSITLKYESTDYRGEEFR